MRVHRTLVGTTVMKLDRLGFAHRSFETLRQILSNVPAGDVDHCGMDDCPGMEHGQVHGSRAEIDDGDSEFFFLRLNHGLCGRKRGRYDVGNTESRTMATFFEIPEG